MFTKRTDSIRAGFSLLELLVVYAMLAILFGLLLSAVQSARASASRLRCLNNLKQQALATHLYHSTYERFPSGLKKNVPYGQQYVGWQTYLLPFVERQAVWEHALRSFSAGERFWMPTTPVGTVINLYGCPNDDRLGENHLRPGGATRVALTSYLGVSGLNLRDRSGIFYADSETRLTDILDGSSSTIMIGERPPSPGPRFDYGWWYGGLGQNGTGSADLVLGASELNWAGNGPTDPFCPPGPYVYSSGRRSNSCDIFHFWSLHANGANFAFADGSVRFLTYSADQVMPALATRNGQESVSPFD